MKLIEVAKRFYQYRDHFEVIWSFYEWFILLFDCEGEMWEWMEFDRCSLFVTFGMLTVNQLGTIMVARLKNRYALRSSVYCDAD